MSTFYSFFIRSWPFSIIIKLAIFFVSIGDQSRIFIVKLNNIPHQEWPGQLKGTTGQKMHDAPENSDKEGDFYDFDSPGFRQGVKEIADAIAVTLKVFPGTGPGKDAVRPGPDDNDNYQCMDVFIADAAELFRKEKGGYYTDPALQAALDWLKDRAPARAWAEQYRQNFDRAITFLGKSREIRDEKKQQEERERLLIEKNRQQQKTLRLTKIFIVIISISLLISLFLVVQTVQGSREVKRLRLEANYNLAKAFGEKARNGLDSGDYRQAWLYMTAALKQEIPWDRLHLQPDLAGALLNREVVNKAFCERWFSPASHSHSEPVTSVAFSPDGKTLASGSVDKTIRQWDLSIYFDFLNEGKPTRLFFTFTQGVEFFWGVKLEGFEYKKISYPLSLKDRAGYNFLYDKKFRPLLDAPAKGQSKFDQILEWAKEQQEGLGSLRSQLTGMMGWRPSGKF
jgi:hypothetical protein